jgi:molybdate transport system ATP-binding protein
MPERGTLVLLGDNGAGKSTILNLVAGFMTPDAGHIRIGHETFIDTAIRTCVPTESRDTGYVFQDYCPLPAYDRIQQHRLWPGNPAHLRDAIDVWVRELAGLLSLLSLCNEKVGSRSGDQRQRVTQLRALGVDPKCLLDE